MKRLCIISGAILAAALPMAHAQSPARPPAKPRIIIVDDEKGSPTPRVELSEAASDRKSPRTEVVDDHVAKAAAPRVEQGQLGAESPYNSTNLGVVGANEDVTVAAPPAPVSAPPISGRRSSTLAWVEASYLWWEISDGPLPSPLVTIGNPLDAVPGAIGQPGTQVIFGSNDIDYGRANGLRFSAGVWSNMYPVGAEVSVFGLSRQTSGFAITSNATGAPAIYLPAINTLTGAEGSLAVSDPLLGFTGNVSVTSDTRFRGAEVNGLVAATSCNWGEVVLLGGLRALDLRESLTLRNQTSNIAAGTFTDLSDRFGTENQFYGGQVGARATVWCDKYFASVTGKIAVGWARSEVDVQGATIQTSPLPAVPVGMFPSGFFTQSTNIGSRTDWECTYVPEVNVRVGCDLFGCLRAFVGYDWLYWCRVARPGNQIDRTLNLTQSPVFGGGALVGVARPAPLLNSTDFFVHGFSAGIELRY